MAEPTASGASCVKVYVLNDHDNWEERCMGQVCCERDVRTNAFVIKVFAKDSGRVALCSPVRPMRDAVYQRQDDTIITWQEHPPPAAHPVPTEIALSFAEEPACKELWDKLIHINSLLTHHEQSAMAKQLLPNALSSSSQQLGPQHHLVAGHGVLVASLNLPNSIPPQHTTPGIDPLMSAADNPLISSSSRDNNSNHRNPHASLVDSAQDMTHSSRFFDDNMETSSPWATDPIEDVIFRDNPNVLFLGSPSTLVPPSVTSDPAAAAGFVMPDPDRAGIEDLYRAVSEHGAIHAPYAHGRVISEVSNGDYVSKLCRVFRECEKSVDIEGLAMLYHIMRYLFAIGTGNVLEVLVDEKNLMDVVGCLEYDTDHVAELEKAKSENKRCVDERKGKDDGAVKKESPEKNSSAISTEEADASEASAGKATDDKAARKVEEGPLSTNAGLEGKGIGQCQSESTDPKPGDHASDVRATMGAKVDSSPSGEPDANAMRENDQGSANGAAAAVVATSDNTVDVKQGDPVQKNVSEETTSSGNLSSDGGERRLVVRVHRDFLERKVSFKSVVPITDPSVVAKIHQNYRVAYIRDAILSRTFDEDVSSALSGVILCNNVDILMYFISGSSALQELSNRLKSIVDRRQAADTSDSKQFSELESKKQTSAKILGKRSFREDKQSTCGSDAGKADTDDAKQAVVPPNEQNSDRDEPVSKAVAVNSSKSGLTDSTGESRTTVVLDPSTSKGQSSRTGGSYRSAQTDSATGGPRSSASDGDDHDELRSMLGLLRELCGVAKNQQSPLKTRFHSMLMDLGVLEIVVNLLLDKEVTIRSLCCDILSAAVIHDQTEVRCQIIKNVIAPEKPEVKQIWMPLRSAPVGQSKDPQTHSISTHSEDGGIAGTSPHDNSPLTAKGSEKACDAEADKATSDSIADKAGVTPPRGLETSDAAGRQEFSLKDGDDCESAGAQSASLTKCGAAHGSETGVVETKAHVDHPPLTTTNLTTTNESSAPEKEDGTDRKMAKASGQAAAAGGTDGEPASNGGEGNSAPHRRSKSLGDDKFPLLPTMVDVICQNKHCDVSLAVLDLLRRLLDPGNMRTQSDTEVFLDVFYEKFISRLLNPIAECVETEKDRKERGVACGPDENASHICDLLSFCVTNHAYRGWYFVLAWDAGGRILKLMEHRKAYIRLSALRFIRACVGMAEDMLDRYIVREKLFDPVMEMLKKNGKKDNLTSSAILDVVSFTYRQSRVNLLKHIVEMYCDVLEETSEYCSAFSEAKKTLEVLTHAHEEEMKIEQDKGRSAKDEEKSKGSTRGLGEDVKHEDSLDVVMRDGEKSGGAGVTEVGENEDAKKEKAKKEEAKKEDEGLGKSGSVIEVSVGEDGDDGEEGSVKNVERRTESKEEKRGSGGKKRKRGVSLVGYSADGDEDSGSDGEKGRSGGEAVSGGSEGSGGMRLSLCRSEVRSGGVGMGERDDSEVEGISETSAESGEEAKVRSAGSGRGRMASGGIETCTQAVMEQEGGSDLVDGTGNENGSPKRRRTSQGEEERARG